MNPNKFEVEALKTESNDYKLIGSRLSEVRNIRLNHAAMGFITEIGEIFEMLNKPNLDMVNFFEEISDWYWYTTLVSNELRIPLQDIFNQAIENKERKNYYILKLIPKKFKYIREKIQKHEAQKLVNLMLIHSSTCLDVMKKTIYYQNRAFDQEKFVKNMIISITHSLELLDLFRQYSHEELMDLVINKLQKVRYKSGSFSSEEASVRDLDAERKVLENKK